MSVPLGGRDRRRRLSLDERRELALRADGRCQLCKEPLGDDWHAAHLISWTHGGATSLGNGEAWCKDCNLALGSVDAVSASSPVLLRGWQEQALGDIVERLYEQGFATLHAAPGAGKTLFAGFTYMALRAMGRVERLMVVVPNTNLRGQWKRALSEDLQIHLDDEPRDGWQEHRDTVGPVVSYQSLPNTAANHRQELERTPTLLVLDEVHHIGEQRSWGKAIARIVGDVNGGPIHAAGVLNMTGTLFRSSGKSRISTVRYRPSEDDLDKIEATADFSILTKQLIPHSLRRPDVLTYGTTVDIFDPETAEVVHGDIADLDRRQQSAVLSRSYDHMDWVEGFVAAALHRLHIQQTAFNPPHYFKLLYVAANQQAAKVAADAINRVAGRDFARLVISDEPGSLKILRRAAAEQCPLAIVAVRMITEGFDCPEIATIAYASNVVADLSIAQIMARAMRITDLERHQGRILPANILIPDHAGLKAAFARALIGQMHLLDANLTETEPYARTGSNDRDNDPAFDIIDLTAPVLRSATVMGQDDGEVMASELAAWVAQLQPLGVPEVYAPAVAVASRKMPAFPRIYSVDRGTPREPQTPTRSAPDPRTLNKLRRSHLDKMAKWYGWHPGHEDLTKTEAQRNLSIFQSKANEHAGIPPKGRDMASDAQLAAAEAWMTGMIYNHCERTGCEVPRWLAGGGNENGEP